MSLPLKKDTASQVIAMGPFLDETDAITPLTSLSIIGTGDVGMLKYGEGTLFPSEDVGTASHLGSGVYAITLGTGETDTAGALSVFCHMSGALPVRQNCVVLSSNFFDSMYGADDLDVNVTKVADTTQTAGDLSAEIGTAQASLDNIEGTLLPNVQGTVDGIDANITGDAYDILTAANVELASIPATTDSLQEMIQFLFEYFRNRRTVTATAEVLYQEDASTALGTSTVSDDGVTFDKGEMG